MKTYIKETVDLIQVIYEEKSMQDYFLLSGARFVKLSSEEKK